MSDVRAELCDKWREAAATSRAGYEWRGVRLGISGPIRFIASVREPDERLALLLESSSDAAPSQPCRIMAHGLSVTDQRRPEEGLFRLAVVLEENEMRDVFEVLVADIVDVASAASTANSGIGAAIRRLEAWRACLRARQLGLSFESQLGLVGELIVLRLLASELGYPIAVDAWQGPLEALHDFSRGGVSIEVKTVVGPGNWLHISHFAQLETAGISALALARPRLQESAAGKSLVDEVAEIRDQMIAAPTVLSEFNDKITRTGYLEIDAPMYMKYRFVLHDLRWFKVSPGFPRITGEMIPTGIVDGAYTIDEAAITLFRLDDQSVRELMKMMKEALHA